MKDGTDNQIDLEVLRARQVFVIQLEEARAEQERRIRKGTQ